MPDKSNKFNQFWKELKRRRVISVIPVYAVAAFVVLQLADMIKEPLHLPPWTMPLLIIFLSVGFIVAVILAWAYDITPKGIEKTESKEKVIEQKEDLLFLDNPVLYDKSIVVLPFENISSDPDQGYFCDGITEEIINTLTHIERLKVIARTTSFAFKNKYEDVRRIGKELGVETILEGSLRKSGDMLRITAQLIRVSDGSHIWSEKFDREMKDIFEIQDEISLAIAEELKIQLFDEERMQILKSYTQNLKAYNYYLKGRFYWNNNRTKEGIEKTIEYFKQAIETDPDYALAYGELANAYVVLADWGYIQPKKAVPMIKELLIKSLELDNTLAENHSSLFYSYALFEWNWQKAEMESRKAFELNPKSPVVHHFYALVQANLGHFKNAIEHNNRARELDPLSLIFNFAYGLILYMSHQYDDAIKQFRKTLVIDNSFTPAYFWTSFSYLQKGLYEETIEEYQNFLLRDTITEKYVPVIDDIFKKSGIEGFLHWLVDEGIRLNKEIYNQPYYLAVCYALLNNKEMAFDWLGEACEQRVSRLAGIKVDPGFDNLRDDPRFSVLLEKVGLQ
jgi:adenylate cyclase